MKRRHALDVVTTLRYQQQADSDVAQMTVYLTAANIVATLIDHSADEDQLDILLLCELPRMYRGVGLIPHELHAEDLQSARHAAENAAAILAHALFSRTQIGVVVSRLEQECRVILSHAAK